MPLSVHLIASGVSDAEILNDFDVVSTTIGLEYTKIFSNPALYATGSDYDCTQTILNAISGKLIANQSNYSYDLVISLCSIYNLYANAVANGLLMTPTPVPPAISVSLFAPPAMVSAIEIGFVSSHDNTKPDAEFVITPDIEVLRLALFTNLNAWLYGIYLAP